MGHHLFGQNVVPHIDDLAALYPHDYSGSGTTLAQFIQAGAGGVYPRPEFSMNDTYPTPIPSSALGTSVRRYRTVNIKASGILGKRGPESEDSGSAAKTGVLLRMDSARAEL